MSTTAQGVAGRYGTDPARSDRRWKRAYWVFAGLFVLVVAAVGTSYVLQSQVSGEIVAFQVVSASEVQIHLQVDKSGGKAASCTVRSRDTDGNEVGRLTVPVPASGSEYDTVVTLRTSARGTTGELVGCS
ncbi:DUF4307 domain-containing protein [Streptacidiphilus sp. EB129]|uniref:DUF4307 domain-containing protein n=1 Tax=Streptacidiphilus sp. EB129 TaxID=3156262 RepID=UPI0035147A26